MSVINDSTAEVSLIYQQIYLVALTEGTILKLVFIIIMSLFFIYVNAIMVYTLWSKPVFKETPRYILFNHMILNDSVQLFVTALLYIFGVAYIKLFMAGCAFAVIASGATFRNTPLNLALMSLERYVAIRFPLRHAEIATQKRTYIAIGVIWFLGLVQYLIDLFYGTLMDPTFLTIQKFCTREMLFIKQWQVDLEKGVNIFFFVSVSTIILFTYVSILITTRSAISSKKDTATKAHKTVLLHLIQLGFCLTSFLYSIIERAAAMASSNSNLFIELQYITYLLMLILPRCLSPLIYGLRDNAVRPLFIYYFRCTPCKCRSTVSVH
ncbi:odorant receptor, family H, subfamily 132, member 1 isoform X1, partial [Silurus asotus]